MWAGLGTSGQEPLYAEGEQAGHLKGSPYYTTRPTSFQEAEVIQ